MLVPYTLSTRIGRDPSLAPRLPGPFDPIPVCPPAMLVGQDGLPGRQGQIVSEDWMRARPDANRLPAEGMVENPTVFDDDYPLRAIPWDGVLVDDEGHPSDIVLHVQKALRVLFSDRAEEVEEKVSGALGVRNLRSYFHNPRGFSE